MEKLQKAENESYLDFQLRVLDVNKALYKKNSKVYLSSLLWYATLFDREIIREIKEAGKNKASFQALRGRARRKYIQDVIFWNYVYGYAVEEYFGLDFAEKSKEKRLTYLSFMEFYRSYKATFTQEAKDKFINKDKWTLYQLFKPMFHRDVCYMAKGHEQDQAMLDFIKKHPAFIVKPLDDYGGHGVHKVKALPGKEQEMLEQLRQEAPIIVEELLIQSEDMASLNRDTVNTIRITTFQGGGEFEIAFASQRIGRASADVDNVSSGGMALLVDLNTHRTLHRMMSRFGIFSDTKHPDTGVELSDFEIPDWEGMLNLVRLGVSLLPQGMHYCGWDLCHTVHGWDLVEVNDTASYSPWEMFTGEGKADYFYKTIAKYAELENQAADGKR